MCVVNEQDSQFPGIHWVMVHQDNKNTYFIDSLGRDFTHYGFIERPVYQVSRRLQCLDSKLCGSYLVFFGCRLTKGLDLNSNMDYFTCDQDSTTSSFTITLKKTLNSENNTRRFRNTEQFTRSLRSVQSSIVNIYENGNFNRRN